MKVLIITGNLAYPLIKNVVANANVEVIIHIADNTQVAAFLTPRIIIDEIKTHTKQFAKRQYTWFKNQMEVIWFDILDKQYPENVFEVIERFLKNE